MMIEEMRRAREESANVAYMTFINHINADKLGLFCFFEGKDSPYYISRIKAVFKGNYYPINCAGKSKVLKVYELIGNHREYDDYKKAFFVDSDFDLPLGNPKIYETPCYSIENLYTTKEVFAEILKSEFGFTEVDANFKRCTTLYADLQIAFHEAATLFNAWYACLIDLKNLTKETTGVDLDISIPKEFVNISINGITSNYNIEAIKLKYPKAKTLDNQVIIDKITHFSTQNKGKIFRGKYEFDFMLKILDALIDDAKQPKKYISKTLKYNITNTQAISQFSQYAETPECLVTYLNNITQ